VQDLWTETAVRAREAEQCASFDIDDLYRWPMASDMDIDRRAGSVQAVPMHGMRRKQILK
jgi:hypothetical protein